MSLNGAAAAALRDDDETRAYRAFQRAYQDYVARPSLTNYARYHEAKKAFLKTWGAEDAA